jgi:HEXXH motif-containing protein
MLLLKAVADEAGAEPVRESYRALTRLYDRAPDRVDRMVRYPAVGVWALGTLQALREGRDARPERMAALAAAAAVRAGVPFEARLPAGLDGVLLPSLGRALVDGTGDCLVRVEPPRTRVIGHRTRVELPADPSGDAAGWQGLRTITARHPAGALELLVDDLDPYRFPPGSPLAPRLEAADLAWWRARFQEAWTILRRHHPTAADEIAAILSVVTPLSATADGPASGTSRTAFGCVALARPTDALSLAVTLVHEVQHAKLAVLLQLVDLVCDGHRERYYAPWRQDPRPVVGLLHGAYAHLAVAAFWRRQRHVDGGDAGHAEFARWRDATAQTVQVILDSSALTPLGHRFVAGMMRTLRSFQSETVPDRAADLAHRTAEWHRRSFGPRVVRARPAGEAACRHAANP